MPSLRAAAVTSGLSGSSRIESCASTSFPGSGSKATLWMESASYSRMPMYLILPTHVSAHTVGSPSSILG
jgi:hypothetical protein